MTSFGDHLREAGYDTRWIGKWHATEFLPETGRGTQGFDNMTLHGPARTRLGLTMDGLWTGQALEFLENDPQGPFFLGLSLHNPHDICYWIMGTDEDLDGALSPPAGVELPPLPPNFRRSAHEPEVMRARRAETTYGREQLWTRNWSEWDWRRYLYAYYRLIERTDHEIGRVLDALERGGLKENTLVVFTSDHGESCAAHELVVKLTCYDESLRVPLLMRWPALITADLMLDVPVSGLDLAPTILDAAGARPLPDARGQSLFSMLRNPHALDRVVVSELYPTMRHLDVQARILCDRDWKYVLTWDGNAFDEALYDLRNDPGEQANLGRDPASSQVRSTMKHALLRWMEETIDPLQNFSVYKDLKQPVRVTQPIDHILP